MNAWQTVSNMCVCSETRAAHKLSAKLNRDIIIGGTTLDTPSDFLEHLKVGRRPAPSSQRMLP